jgi:preprotein translocase subunit SecE
MGRLLKKKDSAKFKRKKKDESVPSDQAEEVGVSSGSDASAQSTAPKSVSKKKTVLAAKPAAPKGEPNFLQKSIQFLKEVKVELKKVTWPSKKQTVGSTVVVIVVVMIISMLLGVMDIGLSSLVQIVLQ